MSCSALNTCQPMPECSFQHWCCVNSCAHICWQWRDLSCLGAVLLCFQSACNKDHSQNEYSSRSLCELNTAALRLLLCCAICLSCVCLLQLFWGRSSEVTILLWLHCAFLSQISKTQVPARTWYHHTTSAGVYPSLFLFFFFCLLHVTCAIYFYLLPLISVPWRPNNFSRSTDDTSPGGLLHNQQKRNSVFQGLEYLGRWAVIGSYGFHNLHGIFSAPALFFCSQRCLIPVVGRCPSELNQILHSWVMLNLGKTVREFEA